MGAFTPSADTTLVVLLGASAWPRWPDLGESQAFANAADEVKRYFLDPTGFGLPQENLLDLFNADMLADPLDEQIKQFLDARIKLRGASGTSARDVLVYFIGHGSPARDGSNFYLAVRNAREDNLDGSALTIKSLADTLRWKAALQRRTVILDCCFAGSALRFLQATPSDFVRVKANEAFDEHVKGQGSPNRGTALLCSSGANAASSLKADETDTMFTEAFIHALRRGTPSQPGNLSLYVVHHLAVAFLRDQHEPFPMPEIYSPGQSEGDVAAVGLFPNPSTAVTPALPVTQGREPESPQSPNGSTTRADTDEGAPPESGAQSPPSRVPSPGYSRRTVIASIGGLVLAGAGGVAIARFTTTEGDTPTVTPQATPPPTAIITPQATPPIAQAPSQPVLPQITALLSYLDGRVPLPVESADSSQPLQGDSVQIIGVRWSGGQSQLYPAVDTATALGQRRVIRTVWAPKGSRVAALVRQIPLASKKIDLFVVDIATGKAKRLAEEISSHAAWSPDSNQLVYATLTDKFAVAPPREHSIRLVNYDGTDDHEIAHLTPPPPYCGMPDNRTFVDPIEAFLARDQLTPRDRSVAWTTDNSRIAIALDNVS